MSEDKDEFRIRQLPVGALLEMFDNHPGKFSEENRDDWEFLRGALCRILGSAASFYDDFDHRHYEFALSVAYNVLNENPPEHVIQVMAGTAHFMLNPLVEEEVKEFSAETRVRLERIRDAHPEFEDTE